LQVGEVGTDGLFVGVGPRGVVVEARDEFEDVDELRELGRGGSGGRSGGGGGRGGGFFRRRVGGAESGSERRDAGGEGEEK